MQYTSTYESPLGEILLAGDEEGLTGLWFKNQKYFAFNLNNEHEEKEISALIEAKQWLDIYFTGKNPGYLPRLNLIGTEFQKSVWEIILSIPYGQTMTYGEIAAEFAVHKNLERMSAQAVGGAVAHNGISIIVPCHRVVGRNGNLTGYAGGIDKKINLLILEGINVKNFRSPL